MIRRAAIDIGTNTILLVIVDVMDDGSIIVVQDEHRIVRLGERVDADRTITEGARRRAKAAMIEYDDLCRRLNVDEIRVGATSAMRDAQNASEVLAELSAVVGVPIVVIHGEDEGRLTYIGTIGTLDHTPARVAVIDVGGGSTELVLGHGPTVFSTTSVDIGAVRDRERSMPRLPLSIAEYQSVRQNFLERLALSMPATIEIDIALAVAGTPTALAMLQSGMSVYDTRAIDGYVLDATDIHEWAQKLATVPLTEDVLSCIDPRRADILPVGATILSTIVERYRIPSVTVSIRGLRYGIASTSWVIP